MRAIQLYYKGVNTLERGKDLPLLIMRLVLAYGFYGPAKMKWANMQGIVDWFRGMDIPAPAFSAYLTASSEAAGVVLLTLGLGTRIITIPLMIVMLVAIKTVHWGNGFDAGENGFEIPLYYLVMLFTLLIMGPGKISLDAWLNKKYRK